MVLRGLLVVVVCLAALLSASTSASAAPAPDLRWPIGSPQLQTAINMGQQHWGGGAICGGTVLWTWEPMSQDMNAEANWYNPTDAWANPDANFQCRVRLNREMHFDWPKLCTVVIHEVGHLRGQDHSPDGRGVMAAFYEMPVGQCLTTPDPSGHEQAAAEQADTAPAEEEIDGVFLAPKKGSAKRKTTYRRVKVCRKRSGKRVCHYKRVAVRKAAKKKKGATRRTTALGTRYSIAG